MRRRWVSGRRAGWQRHVLLSELLCPSDLGVLRFSQLRACNLAGVDMT